jgi:hypothetical protein
MFLFSKADACTHVALFRSLLIGSASALILTIRVSPGTSGSSNGRSSQRTSLEMEVCESDRDGNHFVK